CEQHGTDPAAGEEASAIDGSDAATRSDDEKADAGVLQQMARKYSSEAHRIVAPLSNLSRFHAWAPAVAAPIDTIRWYAGVIPAKVGRALHGAANDERFVDEDPVQNDWNGSAKVARLAIAESIGAWRTLFEAGDTPVDASIRGTANLLEEMDRGLAE